MSPQIITDNWHWIGYAIMALYIVRMITRRAMDRENHARAIVGLPPMVRPPGLISKAISFGRAMLGGRLGESKDTGPQADLARAFEQMEYNKRLAICKTCPHLITKPIFNHTTLENEDKLFCNQCGCGTHALAELHNKLGHKALSCPIGKWGEATAMKPSEASRVITTNAFESWKSKHPDEWKRLDEENKEKIAKIQAEQAMRQANGAASGVLTPSHPSAVPGLLGRAGPTAITEREFAEHFGAGRVRPQWQKPTGPMEPGPEPGPPQPTGITESPPPPIPQLSGADPTARS